MKRALFKAFLIMTIAAAAAAQQSVRQRSVSHPSQTADELRTVDAAVRSARPAAWAECYSMADVSTHCCDLIRTTLSLSARSGRDLYTTSWLTGSQPLVGDLQTLSDILRGPASLDARYRPLCTTMP